MGKPAMPFELPDVEGRTHLRFRDRQRREEGDRSGLGPSSRKYRDSEGETGLEPGRGFMADQGQGV